MNDIHDQSDKVYIILGTHKSGTSFLSKALKDQGVTMTQLDDTSFRRHYEDEEFLNLNKEILKQAGGYWKEPPSKEAIKKVDVSEKIKKLINKFRTKFWGWKDPRNILTVEKYLPYLKEDDVYLVCVFRKPKKVQESLTRVKGENDWKPLINEYNSRLIDVIKNFVGL